MSVKREFSATTGMLTNCFLVKSFSMNSFLMNRYVALFWLLCFSALVTAQSAPPEPQAAPDWAEHISQVSGPLLSKADQIRIGFVNPVVGPEQVGKRAKGIITSSPEIKGKVIFSALNEITLVPQRPLTPGQSYQIEVNTAQLTNIPPALDTYKFTFHVREQALDIHFEGLNVNSANEGEFNLRGNLTTADLADPQAIESVLKTRFLNKVVPILWRHQENGLNHGFTILGLKKDDIENTLNVTWSGKSLGIPATLGSKDIKIPARTGLSITSIAPVQDTRRYIAVYFSKSLDKRQNLKGLVRLNRKGYSFAVESNVLKVFAENQLEGQVQLTLEPGIKAADGSKLVKQKVKSLLFSGQKPMVSFIGKGVVLPTNDRLTIPFNAAGVSAVQVTAFEVFDNNIGHFLQENTLSSNNNLYRVGRFLWRKRIPLTATDLNNTNRFELDATQLMSEHPGSLFRLEISVARKDSVYTCSEAENAEAMPAVTPLENASDVNVNESSGWDFADANYNPYQNASWAERENPCKDAYYYYSSSIKAERNFFSSNIGMIAKEGSDNRLHVVLTDLRNATPLVGASLKVMNFQNQSFAQGASDANGMLSLSLKDKPFYLVARQGKQIGYLKVNDNAALPVSNFDISGEQVNKGVKGVIYGERDVWRPGDKIYLTFVLQDREKLIPANHPVTMQLFNPQGQIIQTLNNASPINGFYTFTLQTAEDAPTGTWNARALLGGSVFTRAIPIETIVPNRLKMQLELGEQPLLASEPLETTLFAQWLQGASAGGLKAEVSVSLGARGTEFKRYSDYVFDDPARQFSGVNQELFNGLLDDDGNAEIEASIEVDKEQTPGVLTARFTTRVYEESGAFSTGFQSKEFFPFDNYVGVRLPKGDAARGMLLTDVDQTVQIATLDTQGEPVSLDDVQVTLYKISWEWWWDKNSRTVANFASSSYHTKISEGVINTKNGQGTWTFQVHYPDWGRYFVRACDSDGGHCSGKVVYIDWPGWAGRAQEDGASGANILNFFPDKTQYTVGETAKIRFPDATQGRALVSIENGIGVIEQRWVEFGKDNTEINLPITSAMSPNVYVSVTLIQPHKDRDNDRPIRLYGIASIKVDDPKTRLEPQILVPEEVKPETTIQVSVSEKSGRSMTYTLALVDEGLLGITNFRTPDLQKHFYAKESLGVKTWDMFDYVVGAYGGELDRLLALGGSDYATDKEDENNKRRFPPVVRFIGPFTLAAGATDKREFALPQYIGAVRVMLVAGKDGAYGLAEQSVRVTEPLAMLSTLPRVLSPGEELQVPIDLFLTDAKTRSVQVSVDADADYFENLDPDGTQVEFERTGEKMAFLNLKVKNRLGKAHLHFTAAGGDHTANSDVYIDIRSPNPPAVKLERVALAPGESWDKNIIPFGLDGTRKVKLEVSTSQPINLQGRMDYLIQYPHGCIEQTTSSVFPQLSLPNLLQLDSDQQARISNNIALGIDRIRSFQTADGGFAYWPGNGETNSWGTNYAGHFLLEAKAMGYFVPAELLSAWESYQRKKAAAWNKDASDNSALDQAYRLYTLALAGAPDLGAMNRLREISSQLQPIDLWQLAAAYEQAGLTPTALELVSARNFDVESYTAADTTFGSDLRDKAIILKVLVGLDRWSDAQGLADEISGYMSGDHWYSTQSVAYGLLSLAQFSGNEKNSTDKIASFYYKFGSEAKVTETLSKAIFTRDLTVPEDKGEKFKLKNTSERRLFLTLAVQGVPQHGEEQAVSQGLDLNVLYTDAEGKTLDVERLVQGTDISARVTVTNTSGLQLKNLALSHMVPSGWEIHNDRMSSASRAGGSYDFQDIRDDRINTYFDLMPGQSREIKIQLNAAYLGKFYLPSITVEAMYDASKRAVVKGTWVEVVKK